MTRSRTRDAKVTPLQGLAHSPRSSPLTSTSHHLQTEFKGKKLFPCSSHASWYVCWDTTPICPPRNGSKPNRYQPYPRRTPSTLPPRAPISSIRCHPTWCIDVVSSPSHSYSFFPFILQISIAGSSWCTARKRTDLYCSVSGILGNTKSQLSPLHSPPTRLPVAPELEVVTISRGLRLES